MTVQLGDAHGKIIIDTSGVRTAVASANRALGSMKTSLGNAAKVMTGALVVGTTALVGGLTAVGISGIKMAMDLEQQMANIQAVMGASTEEIKALEEEIIDLGLDPNLKVSTEEAAAAIEMLGRNGLTTAEILGGAAKAAILLQNAVGGEFSTSADVATDIMSNFNIEASEMERVVDGVTGVISNSKIGIDDYALGLANGGAEAAAFGMSLEDFNTVLALTVDEAGDAGKAGTALGATMARLVPKTDPAIEKMRELGIVTEDGTNKFFDAEGAFLGAANMADVLNDSLGGLSDAERITATDIIFGRDAAATALGMMKETSESVNEASAEINEHGQAAKSAATRMDTLAGAIEIMGGVVDAVKIQFGQMFGGFIREKVEQFTGFLDTASTAVFSFIEMVQNGMEPVQALGYLLSALGLTPEQQTQIKEFAEKFIELKDRFLEFVNEAVIPFITEHAEGLKGALIAIGAVIMGAMVLGAITALLNPLTAVIVIVGLLGAAWAENWLGIRDKTAEATPQIIEWWEKLKITAGQLMVIIVFALYNASQSAQKLTAIVLAGALMIINWWASVMTTANQLKVIIVVALYNASQSAQKLTAIVLAGALKIINWWNKLKTTVKQLKAIISAAMDGIGGKVDGVKGKWEGFVSAVKGFWDWISGKVFKLNIKLPELPDWAIPGSPIPLHTAWKNFATEMSGMKIAPKIDVSSAAILRPPSASAAIQSQIGASSPITQSPTAAKEKTEIHFYGPVTIDGSKGGDGILAQIQSLAAAG